jgi:hypothetical protein
VTPLRETLPSALDEAASTRLVQELKRTFERKIVCGEHGTSARDISVDGATLTLTPCCDDATPIVRRTLALLLPIHFERS